MSKRRRKTGIVGMLSFLALLILCCIPVSAGVQEGAGEYEIYPTPQEAVYGQNKMDLTNEIGVTVGKDIDGYTVKRIDETLNVLKLTKKDGTQNGKTNLIVGVYGSNDEADKYAKANGAEASLFDKQDAYMLYVKAGKIVVVGKNTDAAFYGVTTLKHIFKQITDQKIAELTIKDYSDIQFRGFIEGYYGNPWSIEDRIELMKFGGELKMNQYIFAPKDDPYHNSKWRELYPDSELVRIKELAKAGNESKCFFVWSIHCFMNNAFKFDTEANYQADLAIVEAKFSQLLEAGVRQFGVLADDAAAVTPENTVKLLNDLNDWIGEQQKKYPDLRRDILYCPNDYMGNGSSTQLKGINQVNRNVHIMATGGRIWGEVTPTFGSNYYLNIASTGNEGRHPYMWINWPCSDNSKNHLIMGGQNTFLHAGVNGSDYEGIVLNPMQQSEPSKAAIFMNGDFSWKCWKSAAEGDQAWEDAFKYVDHVSAVESPEATALKEMSKHMINQAMDSRVTALEESVELAPKLAEFTAALQSGENLQAAIDKIRPEFKLLNDAAKLYLEKGTNKRLVDQATPFFSCMRDISQTNLNLLSAVEAIVNGDDNAVWENFSEAQSEYAASKSYGFNYVNETKYAEVGNEYIVPFTNKLMKYVSESVQQILDPEHIKLEETLVYEVGGSSSTNNVSGTLASATDGNLGTSVQIQRNQKVGDYVGLTFNAPVSVSNIRVALWTSSAKKDFFYAGKMQYTTDGKSWVDFEDSLQPNVTGDDAHTVEMQFPVMEIKGFRWVCTDLGGVDRWVAIRDIGYNIGQGTESPEEKYAGTLSYTEGWTLYKDSGPFTNLTDGDDSTSVWIVPTTEVKDTSLAGDFIQLDLGESKQVGRVRALVGAGSADKWTKYHVEYSTDGSTWSKTDTYTGAATGTDVYVVNLQGASARYIKLVNDLTVNKWIQFSEFSVFSYVEGLDNTEMDYTNVKDSDWMVNYGEEIAKVIPKNAATLKPGEYIGLRLDRIHAIKKITTEGTGTDKLTLESGMNEAEMTEGTANAARYIRLINNTAGDVTFDLTNFVVETDEIQSMDLLETTMGVNAQYGQDDARATGTTKNWLDQDLNSRAIYSDYPKKDDTIVYSLGQEMKIQSVKVYVLDTEIDYPRDAVIEVSNDQTNWTPILTIGDGVANGSSDASTKPVDNGWKHDTVDVAFAYLDNTELDVTAKYLRMRMTANYNSRFVALNEIQLNGGAYIPTINDPTFETTAAIKKGYEPQNLNDRDVTSAFKPESTSGSLIYHLSETTKVAKLNIIQTGISHAKISVRTGADTWKALGKLDASLSTFYTFMYDDVMDVKVEWTDSAPEISEIIALHKLGETLESYEQRLQNKLQETKQEQQAAEKALNDAMVKAEEAAKATAAAEAKVAAASGDEKLKAQAVLAKAKHDQAVADKAVLDAQAEVADKAAEIIGLEARIQECALVAETDPEKKQQIQDEVDAKNAEKDNKEAEAAAKKEQAAAKDTDIQKLAEEAAKAQEAANKTDAGNQTPKPTPEPKPEPKPEPEPTTTTYKNVNYKVLSASAKTATAVGVKNKNLKSITIPATVKIGNKTYKVVQIENKAFKGCKKLTKATIGKNVKKIGKEAFAQSKKLKNINMKAAGSITSIGKKAFQKISAKATVTVPKKKYSKYKKMLKKAGLPKTAKIKKA